MYLLDTNVISELRRPRPHPAVLSWIDRTPEAHLFLSAVTIGEIQAGIEITREQDASKATEIENWLDRLMVTQAVLPADATVFRTWARFKHRKPDAIIEDALIAATASVHGLAVVTRNVRDFEPFGVSVLNPFEVETR